MTHAFALAGKLLIAMPGMGDPRFEHAVVFLCAHSADGAMGLIINKPAQDLTFATLLKQLDIPHGDHMRDIRVHFGGPVELSRGFVLHSRDYGEGGSTMNVDDRFAMTTTLDVLQSLAAGRGPSDSLLALGYAGWGPGQLESEIGQNGWLTSDATPDLVFSTRDAGKWDQALRAMGIDPIHLSATAGRA